MKWQTTAAILVVFVMVALSGCATTTTMESRPAGAEVTVDGEYYVGETPVQIRDLPWRGSTRYYNFVKEGYHSRVMTVPASSSNVNTFACLCTLGIMWPLMLFGEFPESLVVTMEREEEAPRAEFRSDPKVQFGN